MRFAVLTALLVSHLAAAAPPLFVTVAVQNEAASLPSAERLFTAFNPGAEAGLGLRWLRSGRLDVFQDLRIGVWHHPGLATSITVRTTAGIRARVVGGLQLGAGLTVGSLSHDLEASQFDRTAGTFAPSAPWVTRFVGGLLLDAGWSFGRLEPFISYGLLVEVPFLAKFSPVLPHQVVQLGVRIVLGPLEAAR